MNAQKLIDQGYRKVSNKFRTISRIDRKDWVPFIYKNHFGYNDIGIGKAVETFYAGMPIEEFGFMEESVMYEAKMIANNFRRCHSKDKIEDVPIEIFSQIPSSDWDLTGFCEKNE